MGRQQLAVCFAPLLLAPALSVAANEPAAYELRRQIDTLRWLLDLWPLPSASGLREPLALFVSAVQYMSSEYTHTHTTHTHTHTHTEHSTAQLHHTDAHGARARLCSRLSLALRRGALVPEAQSTQSAQRACVLGERSRN